MAKEEMNEARVYSNYVIGILSIVLALLTSGGIGGIVLGIIGLVRVKKDKGEIARKARNLNLIGLILGCAMFILSVIISIMGASWNLPTA